MPSLRSAVLRLFFRSTASQETSPQRGPAGKSIAAASRFVRVFGQIAHISEKCRRLSDEKSHVSQELQRAHCRSLGFGGTDDRDYRQLSAQKRTRFRHDQVGLKVFPAERRRIQVWK